MNEMKKRKSYIKDNQGILNTLKMFFCFIGPLVYWFTIIICDCIVRNHLKLNTCSDHACGGWGLFGPTNSYFNHKILQGNNCY